MTLGDNGTDGQTDRRTDRVRRNMRPPPREEGRIISDEVLGTVISIVGSACGGVLLPPSEVCALPGGLLVVC